MAPTLGLRKHQRPLPSVERARARMTPFFSDSLMRTTAASLAPGPARVLVRTLVSYCSVIQRFEAMVGEARSFLKLAVRSVFSGAKGNQSFSRNRSEEHTSELQSLRHLVCRLLLYKKKNLLEKFLASQ